MTTSLNGPLIKQRRIAASLSHQHAADLLGVGSVLLTRIERGDEVHRTVSVVGLLALAEAIGCTPSELFLDDRQHGVHPNDKADEADEEASAQSDTARPAVTPELLIGVLRETSGQIALNHLADAFECRNDDVRTAVTQAQILLEGTGLRVGTRDYHYFLTPTEQVEVTAVRNRIETAAASRQGMDNGQARILAQVIDGRLQGGRRSVYTNSMLAYLTRLGILETNTRGSGYQPSEALAFALDVP